MTVMEFIAYAAALTLAAATPGPAMFTVISTGVSRGFRPAAAVGVGVAAGDVALASLAMLGVAAIAATFGWLFAIVKYAGAAYLVWIGVRMWRSAPDMARSAPEGAAGLRRAAGLGAAIAFGNPKAILFHVSLMPLILDLNHLTTVDAGVVVGIVFTVNIVIMTGYAALSGGLSRWLRTQSRLRWVNRIAGGALIGTGAIIASR